jgi:hypothetical protein
MIDTHHLRCVVNAKFVCFDYKISSFACFTSYESNQVLVSEQQIFGTKTFRSSIGDYSTTLIYDAAWSDVNAIHSRARERKRKVTKNRRDFGSAEITEVKGNTIGNSLVYLIRHTSPTCSRETDQRQDLDSYLILRAHDDSHKTDFRVPWVGSAIRPGWKMHQGRMVLTSASTVKRYGMRTVKREKKQSLDASLRHEERTRRASRCPAESGRPGIEKRAASGDPVRAIRVIGLREEK